MKFAESLTDLTTRWRVALAALSCAKVRQAGQYVLCHSCWCSFVVGAIMLVLGAIQKSHIIRKSDTPLLEGAGIFFLIIGGTLVLTSPMFALYEYCALGGGGGHRRDGRRANGVGGRNNAEAGTSSTATTEYPNDLPTYEEITKHDNANNNNHHNSSARDRQSITSKDYPEMLAVDTLGGDPFGLPDYEDIVRTEVKRTSEMSRGTSTTTTTTVIIGANEHHQHQQQQQQQQQIGDDRDVATIIPSVQIIEDGSRRTITTITANNDNTTITATDGHNRGRANGSWIHSRQ